MTETGTGEPLLLVMGTSGSLGLWEPVVAPLAERYRVIAYDARGLGESERGDGPITMASMAADAGALLDALEIERAHVMGWSLGSAVSQELAIARPENVGGLVLYGTWGRVDGFMQTVITTLSYPWTKRDMEVAFTALGLAFSPEALNSPDFEAMLEHFLPFFPQTEGQIGTTIEQFKADEDHDTLDRLGSIRSPTLVVAGEQDLVTPPWLGRDVADRIPGARYELLTGPGSSHGLMMERTEEFLGLVSGFLQENRLS